MEHWTFKHETAAKLKEYDALIAQRVLELEAEGLTTSDAQSVADVEIITRQSIAEGKVVLTYDVLVDAGYFRKNEFTTSNGSFDGLMFETYGAEVAFIHAVAREYPKRVCTLLECDGKMYLASGYHYVNRFGYFVARFDLPAFDELLVDDGGDADALEDWKAGHADDVLGDGQSYFLKDGELCGVPMKEDGSEPDMSERTLADDFEERLSGVQLVAVMDAIAKARGLVIIAKKRGAN